MSQVLQQAQRMQEQLMSTQREIAEAEVTGTAGGGLVRATVTGAGDLIALHIDPSVVDPDDVDTLSDLIVAAFRDARAEIQRRTSEQLGAIDADVANMLQGAGGEGSPLAGLFGGAAPETEPGAGPGALSGGSDDTDDDATGENPPGRDS